MTSVNNVVPKEKLCRLGYDIAERMLDSEWT